MTQIALSIPVSGLPNSTEDPKVAADLTTIQTAINGQLDYSNMVGGDGIHRFSYRLCTSNATAVSGDWIVAGPGVTITLPAPTKNLIVAITGQGTVTSASPVTVAGSNIYGVGLSAASSFKLGVALAHVILQADNAGNWLIISGQQDTGWVSITIPGGGFFQYTGSVPAARLVADRVFLRGGIAYGIGIGAASIWGTIPSGMRPLSNFNFNGLGLFGSLTTATVGTVLAAVEVAGTIRNAEAASNGGVMVLDGLSYSLSA